MQIDHQHILLGHHHLHYNQEMLDQHNLMHRSYPIDLHMDHHMLDHMHHIHSHTMYQCNKIQDMSIHQESLQAHRNLLGNYQKFHHHYKRHIQLGR